MKALAWLGRLWPRRLKGQMLLTVALALLLAQSVSAVLIYQAQKGMREAALVNTAAFRLLRASRGDIAQPRALVRRGMRVGFWVERSSASPLRPADSRDRRAEATLREVLQDQDVTVRDIVVLRRPIGDDPAARALLTRRAEWTAHPGRNRPERQLLAAIQAVSGEWLVARVFLPPGESRFILSLAAQTLFIYAFLVGAIFLIVRRITRPLATLTGQIERFAETRDSRGQISPEGPEDVRRLIIAHNAMEDRISTLLDEKDVMLGAIGHDLKTPLAALRVRIESVEDDHERGRMAATIADITQSLDDILSLARVGRVRDSSEMTELSALLAAVAEEYEDMGEPVTLVVAEKVALPLRATWLRRAIRNLIDNALRYGKVARLELARVGSEAVLTVEDDGPGIPESEMQRMLEPFTRGEPSRNSGTGGAGLGLALARAIAEQHGGRLELANRREAGAVTGLSARLNLPLG